MRTVQSWTCELGYGADTMFHRTYFLYCLKLLVVCHKSERIELISGAEVPLIYPGRQFGYHQKKVAYFPLELSPKLWT